MPWGRCRQLVGNRLSVVDTPRIARCVHFVIMHIMSEMKVPPSNSEAERAVLGSILLHPTSGSGDRVMDLCLTSKITPESFFDPRNKALYVTMLEMNRMSKPLDPLTLIEELTNTGKLDTIGGETYVMGLIDRVPVAAHAEHYIRIVRDKHLRRMLIDRASEVIGKCYDEGKFPDPRVVLGEAEKSFLDVGGDDSGTMAWGDAVNIGFRQIDKLFESRGNALEGLSTGLTHLDETLQGLKPSEMIVIAARPSVGKTSLAMNIAESCALGMSMNNVPIKFDGGKRHPVGVFSLEMPVEALSKRMIAGRAGINMWRLARNLVPTREKRDMTNALVAAAGELKQAPIYVDDTASLDVMDLRARARRMKKRFGIELIVIDYLQLCTCREASRQGRQIEVSMISQQIKAMAKELKIPVIVLSQLSRANEQRGDKFEKPKLSDLRDSGAIEQDADVVFLLRRPSRNKNDPESNDETLAIIDVAKNRNGETGEVRVNFVRECTRFFDRPIQGSSDAEAQSADVPENFGPQYTQEDVFS